MKRTLVCLSLAASLFGAAGCIVRARAGVVAEPPPPVAVVEVEEEPPPPRVVVVEQRPGFIWVEGRWYRRGGRWDWIDGHYERERVGYVWVPGRWDRRGRRHVWIEGSWHAGGPVVRDHRAAPPPPPPPPAVEVRDHRR